MKTVHNDGIVVGKDNIPIIEEAVQSLIREATSNISTVDPKDPNFYN